jgi:perosamine synthetase
MDSKWTSGNELKYLKDVIENSDEVKKNSFVDRLEEAFCNKYGIKYAIAVNSGTSGLHAALEAVGVGKDDEVITTCFTVLVDGSVPLIMGAKPVFADIEYDTHNIDPTSVEKLITKNTKAIMPVSIHGTPYNIDEIRKIGNDYNIPIIEDNAQAMLAQYKGRLVGKDADMTMFSFERTKHVASGEGGILITDNEELAIKARKFSGMGFKNLTAGKSKNSATIPLEFQNPQYKRNDALGLNYRYNEFSAAVTLAQFERGEELTNIRRNIAKIYDNVFIDSEFFPQTIPDDSISSYFTYAVKTPINNVNDWKQFHDVHIKNGGDDFYAAMALVYTEPIMKQLGIFDKFNGKCPNGEKIQPCIMQFKTNYRSVEEAEQKIEILKTSLKNYQIAIKN